MKYIINRHTLTRPVTVPVRNKTFARNSFSLICAIMKIDNTDRRDVLDGGRLWRVDRPFVI